MAPPPPVGSPPFSQSSGFSSPRPQESNGHVTHPRKILVERLSKNVLEGHVKEIFGHYGQITDLFMPWNRHLNHNRGTAEIEYEHSDQAMAAIKHMNGGQIDGKVVNVRLLSEQDRRPSADHDRRPSYDREHDRRPSYDRDQDRNRSHNRDYRRDYYRGRDSRHYGSSYGRDRERSRDYDERVYDRRYNGNYGYERGSYYDRRAREDGRSHYRSDRYSPRRRSPPPHRREQSPTPQSPRYPSPGPYGRTAEP